MQIAVCAFYVNGIGHTQLIKPCCFSFCLFTKLSRNMCNGLIFHQSSEHFPWAFGQWVHIHYLLLSVCVWHWLAFLKALFLYMPFVYTILLWYVKNCIHLVDLMKIRDFQAQSDVNDPCSVWLHCQGELTLLEGPFTITYISFFRKMSRVFEQDTHHINCSG